MFIAIYEFEVKEGFEEQFRSSWLKLTQGIYHRRGSLGSRLHATDKPNVFFVTPNGRKRTPGSRTKRSGTRGVEARAMMRESLINSETIYKLEVVEDYLQRREFAV